MRDSSNSMASAADFTGTYWVSIKLPTEFLAVITSFVATNISPDDLCDPFVNATPIQDNPHISVLLGLPRAPDEGLEKLISELPSFSLEFGKLKCFKVETKTRTTTVIGTEGKDEKKVEKLEKIEKFEYQVLHVGVENCEPLNRLQKRIGSYYGDLKWHHPRYNPHVTVAFVKKGVAAKLAAMEISDDGAIANEADFKSGKLKPTTIFAADKVFPVNEVTVQKFRDKSFKPVKFSLAKPEIISSTLATAPTVGAAIVS